MKNIELRAKPWGFTLIELLVVIAIIAILAALLLPTLTRGKLAAQKKMVQVEISKFANSIAVYDAESSRFPTTKDAQDAANANQEDFTYGTKSLPPLKTPTGTQAILSSDLAGKATFQTNNAELIAVLMDLETYPNGQTTVNQGHVKNPQKTRYLSANSASDAASHGIGTDGVYRDVWGTPYIVTIDLNFDNKTWDPFYRTSKVSKDPSGGGLYGLVNTKDPTGASDFFECRDKVMIWSAGPDKMIDPLQQANQGANKDNILSWKP